LARQRYGALIVLERDTGLQDYVERAEPVDAPVSHKLLITIFFPNTPLHDGAIIIRADRVIAAAAVLPLTAQPLEGSLGTRHRAGLGISEESDAVAIVVSEETGQISLAVNGELTRGISPERLRRMLFQLLHIERPAAGEAQPVPFTD
jgi:diadenylate cyclase